MGQGAADDQLAALRQLDETWTVLHNLVQTGAMAPVVLPADERRYPKVLKEAQILYGRLANVLGRASMEHPAGGWFDAFQHVLGQPNISGIVRGPRVNLELWEKLWTLAASAIAQAIGGLEAQSPDSAAKAEAHAPEPAAKGEMAAGEIRARLEEQLSGVEELIERGSAATLEDIKEWVDWTRTVIKRGFGEDSERVSQFQAVMNRPWRGPVVPNLAGYRERLPEWRRLLRMWTREIDEFETPSDMAEQYIPPRSQFDAYVALKGIMETAAGSLMVVDPYTDDATLQLLKGVSPDVHVRVLTVKAAKDFDHVLELFRQQWGGKIEARQGPKELHDRFLLVDDRVFFSGASFKDVGRRGSFIAEIRTGAIKEAVRNDIKGSWEAAQPIA